MITIVATTKNTKRREPVAVARKIGEMSVPEAARSWVGMSSKACACEVGSAQS